MVKKTLFGGQSLSPALADLTATIARAMVGLSMALGHGLAKMPPAEKFVSGVAALGFPQPSAFAWAAALAEFLGGLLLAIGFATRPSAFFIAFTMAVAAFGQHASDPFEKKELALLYFALALVFLAIGGGRFSVDRFLRGGK